MNAMTFLDVTLIQSLVADYGYAAVFVVVMLESSGLPLPGETVLVCAAVYAGTQHGLDIRFIIGAAACGAILADNFGFWAGRRFGRRLLLKYGHFVRIDSRQLALGSISLCAVWLRDRVLRTLRCILESVCSNSRGSEPVSAFRFRHL